MYGVECVVCCVASGGVSSVRSGVSVASVVIRCPSLRCCTVDVEVVIAPVAAAVASAVTCPVMAVSSFGSLSYPSGVVAVASTPGRSPGTAVSVSVMSTIVSSGGDARSGALYEPSPGVASLVVVARGSPSVL